MAKKNFFFKKKGKGKTDKKKKSEKISNIKDKDYDATVAKNQDAISTVAKRLSSVEKKVNLLQIRNTYYYSNNYQWVTIATGLPFGVIDTSLITQPTDMTPALNYDGQLSPANTVRHNNSLINVRATLLTKTFRPVYLNVVILRLKKSAYNQVQLRGASGSGLAAPSTWENGRELYREIGLTNGTTNFSGMYDPFWNPKFFKVIAKRRLYLGLTDSGYFPQDNYAECSIPVKIGITYKKKSYTSTTPPVDTAWTSIDGYDYDKQIYMVIYHEGFDEVQHTSGLNVVLNTEMRHSIKQKVEKN